MARKKIDTLFSIGAGGIVENTLNKLIHYQLAKYRDNAKHHPEINTFPNHLHDGSEENVIGHRDITGIDVIKKIIKEIADTYV
jgi:hypothetical protein